MPVETIEYLLSLDIPLRFIQGNGDREVLARMRGAESSNLPAQAREAIDWVAQTLPPKYQDLLAAWPKTLTVKIEHLGEVLFCHATPRNDTEMFTRLTPERRLLPIFEAVSEPVVVCGHTHMQFDRIVGKTRVVNAGSVGMPFGESGADWLLLGPGPAIQLRHSSYDLAKAADRIRDTPYPQAQDFAARHILKPPSEDEMLQAFSRVEIQ
jgi:diadenosine tetraphosphatase ApaH/serine/threonine PP2A family protein phosphatase